MANADLILPCYTVMVFSSFSRYTVAVLSSRWSRGPDFTAIVQDIVTDVCSVSVIKPRTEKNVALIIVRI